MKKRKLPSKPLLKLFSSRSEQAERHGNLLLSEGSILDILEREIRERGFVGSTDVPKLVFLASYTRLFERPVSMVINGSSGSGKSFGLKAGLQFVPADAYEIFSGVSEKA